MKLEKWRTKEDVAAASGTTQPPSRYTYRIKILHRLILELVHSQMGSCQGVILKEHKQQNQTKAVLKISGSRSYGEISPDFTYLVQIIINIYRGKIQQ